MARISFALVSGAAMVSIALGACAAKPQAEPLASNDAASPLSTPMAGNSKTALTVEKANFEFSYSWPEAAAEIPTLQAHFEALAAGALLELEGAYAADERLSDPNEEYKPTYAGHYDWAVDARSGPLLSLSGSWFDYTGGAHGMYGVNAFMFNVDTDSIVASTGVIGNIAAFRSAMEEEFCRLLDTEREKRRGEPVSRGDFFGDCIDPLEQTVVWKSSEGANAFDRVEIFVGPYAAGSYAEGAYALNLPITPAMMAAIHPQYRDYFAINGGNPYAVEDQ